MQHKRQRGVFLLHLLHVPRSKGAGSASCRGGRASAKTRPDSGSDPQTPCPARTLKLSSRRHRLPARPPTAPLLSGLLAAPAQCQRPRDSARALSMRARAGSSRQRCPRKRTGGPLLVRRPSPTRRRLGEKSSRAAIRLHTAPPPGPEDPPWLRCARGANSAALPRHGIVRMPADASASSAQSSGTTTTQSAP